jgi:hypothetical protein
VSAELDYDGGHRAAAPGLIDVTVPNAARASDFLQGGQDHFAADRRAAEALVELVPSIAAIPPSVRAFRRRVVRYLAADAGIRQFLDIGDGLVPPGNTYQVAQAVDPGSRIVYVESDPLVRAHSSAAMTCSPGGIVRFVDGDIADVSGIIAAAGMSAATPGALLDAGRPVAVLLLSTLSHVPSADDAAKVVAGLMDPVPSGSYLAIYHLASDLDPSMATAFKQWNVVGGVPITLRSAAEVAALVTGLDPVRPGLVPLNDWRPDDADPPAAATPVAVHALVARKR